MGTNPFWDGDGVQGKGQVRDHLGRWVALPGKSHLKKIGVWELDNGSFGVFENGKQAPAKTYKSKRSALLHASAVVDSDESYTAKVTTTPSYSPRRSAKSTIPGIERFPAKHRADIQKAVDEMNKKYPAINPEVLVMNPKEIEAWHEKNFGYSEPIRLDASAMYVGFRHRGQDLNTIFLNPDAAGYSFGHDTWDRSLNMGDVYRHEFGHAIAHQMQNDKKAKSGGYYLPSMEYRKLWKELKTAGYIEDSWPTAKGAKELKSEYSGENIEEFMAEAWLAYLQGDRSPAAKMVGKFFEERGKQ